MGRGKVGAEQGGAAMSKAKKEVQLEVQSDAHWKDLLKAESGMMVEVYSTLWGQCQCFKQVIQRLYFEHMDTVKFYLANADTVESLAEFKANPRPVFLLYKDGQRIDAIQGVNGPQIERALSSLAGSVES